ncbi:MAG: agmatinase family protein [Candidatus Magasanikbacteria bacterium]|nr:agmatinase family protein [Candidatus Magasanikbacteria bacterium]
MKRNKLNKQQKIASYDPGMIYAEHGLFGLPFTNEESDVVLIPMPWEVTTSYRDGTAQGPEFMTKSSYQVDLYDEDIKNAWHAGIAMESISKYWLKKNKELRPLAEKCIANIEKGGTPQDKKVIKFYEKINAASHELNTWMKAESARLLNAGKLVGVVGGEHSVPYGLMQALGEKYNKYSILHIDAHADYRQAYEGFAHSHASIQYNAGLLPCVENQVLLSIRDYSEEEAGYIAKSRGKIIAFSDRILKRNSYTGTTWQKQCEQIIKPLGENVYISFDIDALDPSLCPHTGTPVPGGLEFEQVFYLLESLLKAGKKIIGFDLCEVAPGAGSNGEWDAIVGARALYRLSLLLAKSHGKKVGQ